MFTRAVLVRLWFIPKHVVPVPWWLNASMPGVHCDSELLMSVLKIFTSMIFTSILQYLCKRD